VVEGGRAIAVTFRSLARIREFPDSLLLMDLFQRANLKCALGVLPLTSFMAQLGTSEPVVSDPVIFGESAIGQRFPKDIQW
jgi:hypothetical protein